MLAFVLLIVEPFVVTGEYGCLQVCGSPDFYGSVDNIIVPHANGNNDKHDCERKEICSDSKTISGRLYSCLIWLEFVFRLG